MASLRESMNIPNMCCRIDKIFVLGSLLPAFCYGTPSNYGTITVREGEMANLPIKLNTTTAAFRDHILIVRFTHTGLNDTVLDYKWSGNVPLTEQTRPGFSLEVNGSSLLVFKINQASKDDSGIYECRYADSEVMYKWNVTVQEADQVTFEGSNQNLSESTLTTPSTPLFKNGSGNDDWEQRYEHLIPIILGVLVVLAFSILVYLINRHFEKFQQCCHTRKKTETDEIKETKAELLGKDIKITEKVDNNDKNL